MQLLENKIIRIVEERGYMGTKYIPVIKQIIKFVESYIIDNPKNQEYGWQIYIPDTITSKIDCIDILMLTINIFDKNDGYRHSGSGSNSVFPNNSIVNNKLAFGKIIINGFSNGTDLFERTVFNPLSHEFNHLFEVYKKLLNNQKSRNIYQKVITQNDIINKIFSKDEHVNAYIRDIFYRLLFRSELNALINSVYADLDSINSFRNSFKNDIKKTQAYYIYNDIRKDLDLLDLLTDEEWENIIKCYNLNSIDGTKQKIEINYFKIKFKRLIIEKLNTLMKGIGRVASYYYDVKETNINLNEVLEIVDEDTILNIF